MKEVLITGANGEVGQSLIHHLTEHGGYEIVALDLRDPSPELARRCKAFYRANILDRDCVQGIAADHHFQIIFHLAAMLSASGEKYPDQAHQVNVEGSRTILDIARQQSEATQQSTIFMFASSIAAYGVKPHDDQSRPVQERQYLTPHTMYGINKLYIEQIGAYFASHFRANAPKSTHVDFRCVRFPGLISPDTAPTGGTSDYGPEMLHAAAKGEPYASFVGPDTRMPFMLMSDAVRSLLMLSRAEEPSLNQHVYNVTSFSVSAEEIRQEVCKHFQDAQISYEPVTARQAIVDSWPNDMDDAAARRDWNWSPEYDFESAFELLAKKLKTK